MAVPPQPPAPPAAPTRNMLARAQNRRDTWLQIAAPIALATLVMLVFLVLVILPVGAPVRGPLADVALTLMIAPTLIVGLLVTVLLIGLAFGLALGIVRLPHYFKIVQDYADLVLGKIQAGVEKVSDGALSVLAGVAAAQRVGADLLAMVTFHRRP